jgi:hypothetical protein
MKKSDFLKAGAINPAESTEQQTTSFQICVIETETDAQPPVMSPHTGTFSTDVNWLVKRSSVT